MSVKDLKLIQPEFVGLNTAVQVGSQSGNEAEYLASLGFEVLCIDPEPLHKSNGRITVLEAAVSDQSGMALMYRAGGMNSLDRDYAVNWRGRPVEIEYATSVPVIRLADLDIKPDVLIVDAEGMDHKVLKGLGNTPSVVMFEMTKTYLDRAENCLITLKEKGYNRFLSVFHCGDDIVGIKIFDDNPLIDLSVDWFANIIAKLDPNPWRLND